MEEAAPARILAGALFGVEARAVQVEAAACGGMPGFDLIGVAERASRECRTRVRAAFGAQGLAWPARHVVVNLAPADLPKQGSGFDLAVALAVLAVSGDVPAESVRHTLALGEIGLDGSLRPVSGLLAFLESLDAIGAAQAVVPAAQASEAALAHDRRIVVARSLGEVVAHLRGDATLPAPKREAVGVRPAGEGLDLADVRGQPFAVRALEVAAAGGHAMILVGPPGAGKTMLAQRLPTLLPPPSGDEVREMTRIASIAGHFDQVRMAGEARPFRAPHHSASAAALVGGGDPVRPGEVTLAHRGVLFLDELPEFRREALESLRTAMESGWAYVARAKHRVRMPARTHVLAAMNPCPCGYAGAADRICSCAPQVAARYRQRLSGPMLDRFDLQVRVERVAFGELAGAAPAPTSQTVRERVRRVRRRQQARGPFQPRPGCGDGVEAQALHFLERMIDAQGLSARSYVRTLRVARTLADLADAETIALPHVSEALNYRILDMAGRVTNAA